MEEENKGYKEIDESGLTEVNAADLYKMISTSDFKHLDKYAIRVEGVIDSKNLGFENLRVTEANLLLENLNIPFKICFFNCLFESIVEVTQSTFNDIIEFNNCLFSKQLSISQSTFEATLILNNCSLNNMKIGRSNFNGGLRLAKCNIKGQICRWTQNIYAHLLHISDCSFNQKTTLLRENFENGFTITNSRFSTLELVESISHTGSDLCNIKIKERLTLVQNTFFNLKIYQDKTNSLLITVLEFMNSLTGMVSIYNGTIHELLFNALTLNPNSTINIQPNCFHKIIFIGCINFGTITFNAIKGPTQKTNPQINNDKPTLEEVNSGFLIEDSNMGRTAFFNSSLDSFSSFNIKSSIISDITIIGTTLPKTIGTNISTDSVRLNNEQLQFTYAQLKQVYQKQGDLLSSTNYYALEMDAYRQTLSFCGNFFELLTLWANKLSNNHGTSWAQSGFVTICITLLFYTLYSFSLGLLIKCSPYCMASMLNPRFWSGLFEFFLPIHRFGFLGVADTGWSSAIDVIGRIFIGYGIYQTVQAFRKHGRR